MTTLTDLATPALLVDRDLVERNTTLMREKARQSRVGLRPHVKTHKTLEIARMQLGAESGPITVSTLAEAEFFADGGFRDITYAVPIAPGKLDRAATLAARIDRLNLLIDHPDTLGAIEAFAAGKRLRFDLFLEIDSGYHRSGLLPDDPQLGDLAIALARSSAVNFRGLLTHAGHSYHARNVKEIVPIAVSELEALDRVATILSAQGIHGLVRSIGSTPTASAVTRIPPADELRPGNYVFYDAFQAAIGSCALADCAATVLTTIVGIYPQESRMIVDAGALAMSKDAGATHIHPDPGFGVVCDLAMQPLPLEVRALSQEHGHVYGRPGANLDGFRVGTKLRIIPNHSCLTAAMFDRYHVVTNGEVVDEWKPARGW